MSEAYEETIAGCVIARRAPGARHELVLGRLHALVRASVGNFRSTVLLARRTPVSVAHSTTVCPDLALVTAATGRLWLAAEVISSDDHRTDTVLKKQVYEEVKLPRLWVVDPRYDNVEVYHATPYGLSLKHILAGREVLSERLLPEFELTIFELFGEAV
jgi:Uma2 family endonuclease